MEKLTLKVCKKRVEDAEKEYLRRVVGKWRESMGILGGILVPLIGMAGLAFFSITGRIELSTS